ncbi:hypothetical protein [Mesorhizobium australicum]|uniref:hypothetical protein n=1 Tax=Mesorhizobium australicum TaxID=536018 RepID=UPI000A1CE45B|nr:hypothetical protein [Mesorhizobium australicum]
MAEGKWLPVRTFAEVPRIGELIAFTPDDVRDERGVILTNLYRVTHVLHTAATEISPATVTLDVVVEQLHPSRA